MSLDGGFETLFEEFEPLQWGVLRELCGATAEFFSSHQDENGLRIKGAITVILDHLDELRSLYKEIAAIAPQFDFDEHTPGNGYRSFLILVDKCIVHICSLCRQIYCRKDSVFFRKNYYMKEIEACSQLITSLCTCLHHVKLLYSWSEITFDGKPSLFPSDEHGPSELLSNTESINQYCFYGRCLGFQYSGSMRRTLKTILFSMALFSEAYFNNGTVLGRCANSVKYLLDPEARARRIVNISQHADIAFSQSFWLLNESAIIHNSQSMVMPSVAINQVISIPPEEIKLPDLNGKPVSIPIPKSHIGRRPIHVRLISAKRRIGMVGSGGVSGELLGQSNCLIIHSHGGGFVAQSSRSHEVYLRLWAVKLGVPILSIDYSLAPEAPYPRALEDVLYSYAWALNHASTLLGTTAEKVLFVGDSAGANLNLGTILRCIELNIRRPDGVFMAYAPVLVNFTPSPSRLLCLADPLLPFGIMMRCLKAYAAVDDKKNAREKQEHNKECVENQENGGSAKSDDTESFAEVSESDLIALALSPNGEETNDAHKLASLPSDSTLNSISLAEVDDHPKESAKSQEYIKRFVDLYKNSGLSISPATINDNTDENCDSSSNGWPWTFFRWPLGNEGRESRELEPENGRSPLEEFAFTVPRDPLLSPYLASDEVLAHLPPIRLLTMEMDPCLDDCVMFARKLKTLGNTVSVDVLSGLPHGFLNFMLVSKEAHEGAELCATRIQELLDM